jgi:hypothetical protein
MLNDALRLTIDVAFGPKKGQSHFEPEKLNVFSVPGHPDINENLWGQPLLSLDKQPAP